MTDNDPAARSDPDRDPDRDDVLDDLFAVIEDRLQRRPDGSYTASLVDGEKGADAALEKVGEEAVEVVLAAKNDGDALAAESADLVYHLLVVLAAHDCDLEDLRAELRERR